MLNRFAFAVAGLILVAALLLLIYRGGLIAWSALLIGIVLVVKIAWKPSGRDLGLGIGAAILLVLAWVATFYYVISTWESGEVVELKIDTPEGPQIARLWVMDIDGSPTVYYDADPQAANSLLGGKPIQFTRAEKTNTRVPEATRVDAMTEAEANVILEAMEAKYGERNGAAVFYYALLGSARDRIPVVVRMLEN